MQQNYCKVLFICYASTKLCADNIDKHEKKKLVSAKKKMYEQKLEQDRKAREGGRVEEVDLESILFNEPTTLIDVGVNIQSPNNRELRRVSLDGRGVGRPPKTPNRPMPKRKRKQKRRSALGKKECMNNYSGNENEPITFLTSLVGICITVGCRVAVWYDGELQCYFLGKIEKLISSDHVLIHFDNGDKEEMELTKEMHSFDEANTDRWIFENEIDNLPLYDKERIVGNCLLQNTGKENGIELFILLLASKNFIDPVNSQISNLHLTSSNDHKKNRRRDQIWNKDGVKYYLARLSKLCRKRNDEAWYVDWVVEKLGCYKISRQSSVCYYDSTWIYIAENVKNLAL